MRYFVIFLVLIGFAGTSMLAGTVFAEEEEEIMTFVENDARKVYYAGENIQSAFYDHKLASVIFETGIDSKLKIKAPQVYKKGPGLFILKNGEEIAPETKTDDCFYYVEFETTVPEKIEIIFAFWPEYPETKEGCGTFTVSPLKQYQFGISVNEVQCKESLVLITKYDGSPTCVTPETKEKLIERGWTKDKISKLTKTDSDNNTQKLIELLERKQVSEFNNLKETMDLSRIQVSLEGADLHGIDLREINLERVHIEHANLKDANLQGIVLDYRNIQYTDLQGADLSNADIRDTYLYDVNLQGADLTGASMKNTHIYDSNLDDANLHDADLRGVNFQGASVIRTNFQGADLQGALMAETNLKKINFDGANMQFVNLKYADLHDASLQNTNLQNANLENADLRGANLSGADLQGANLNNADLLETNLSNVQNLPISKEEARQRGAITE